VNFVNGELETREPVLELYSTRVCARVVNGVVHSRVNRSDLGDCKCSRKESLSLRGLGFLLSWFDFLLIY